MSSQARQTKADVVSDFRRAQILEAARQNFIRHGLAHTTVDGIARTAGVAKGTVYVYYASKDEILQQLLSADLAELERETVPAIAAPGTVEERLRRFFGAALGFFERKRDFLEHCQLEMTPDVRKKARQKLGLVFGAQTNAWQRVIEDVGRSPESAPGRARAIVSLAHGLALQRLRGWHTGSVDETVAAATALISEGLTRP